MEICHGVELKPQCTGSISEIEQRSTASICPRQQPQASRTRYIPRQTHDRAKSQVSVCTLSLQARTHTCSIPYKIQQQQQRSCPAPITVCSDATGTQGDKTIIMPAASLRETHFLLKYHPGNFKGRADFHLITGCRSKNWDVNALAL